MTTSSSSASKAARKQTCTARCPTANVVDWRDFRCLRILWKLRHLFHFVSPSCILLQLLVSETIWMELVQQKHACTIPWTILLNFCYQRCIMIHRIPDECWVVQKYLRRCHHRNLPKNESPWNWLSVKRLWGRMTSTASASRFYQTRCSAFIHFATWTHC